MSVTVLQINLLIFTMSKKTFQCFIAALYMAMSVYLFVGLYVCMYDLSVMLLCFVLLLLLQFISPSKQSELGDTKSLLV